jgi:ATP phosphoribosyltransferase
MELTDTEATLRAHNLRVLEVVMESTPRLVASQEAWENAWKRSKLECLSLLLQGACTALGKVGLKMNVAKENLDAVLALLPAMKRPTVSPLAGEDWFAVESILDEEVVKELIPKLKRAGAEGIIEYPLNKVIP